MFLLVTSYGLRYVAMSLRVTLAEKFPEAPESEILKVTWILFIDMKKLKICVLSCEKYGNWIVCFQVVGNLIYYRYMNPAIVAPDAFDVVSFGVDKGLTPDQVQQRTFISEKKYHT